MIVVLRLLWRKLAMPSANRKILSLRSTTDLQAYQTLRMLMLLRARLVFFLWARRPLLSLARATLLLLLLVMVMLLVRPR